MSTLGSQISLVAFPLLVLTTTRSPARQGSWALRTRVPVLAFYLPAGVLVDRRDRRAIMIDEQLIGALALASVPVALALGHLPFGQIMIVAFLAGARQVVYSVAGQSALPLVVRRQPGARGDRPKPGPASRPPRSLGPPARGAAVWGRAPASLHLRLDLVPGSRRSAPF